MDNKKWKETYELLTSLCLSFDEKKAKKFTELTQLDVCPANCKKAQKFFEDDFWNCFMAYCKMEQTPVVEGFFGDCLLKFPKLWINQEMTILSFLAKSVPNSMNLKNAYDLCKFPPMNDFLRKHSGLMELTDLFDEVAIALTRRALSKLYWTEDDMNFVLVWLPIMLDYYSDIQWKMEDLLEELEQTKRSGLAWNSIVKQISQAYRL